MTDPSPERKRTSGRRSPRLLWNLLVMGSREMTAALRYKAFGTARFLGCKPVNVNIEITSRCCLRCQMCNIWDNYYEDELSIDEWIGVIDALKGWLGPFRLTITGGEPFMKAGIWDFIHHCVDLDLPVILLTNGYCLPRKDLEHLLSLPLAQVTFSLDSMTPEVHDAIRGVPGAFKRAYDALCFLGQHERTFFLATNTVIMNDNILELGTMARQLAEIGVERVLFQPVQRSLTAEAQATWPYNTPLWPSSADRVEQGIASLLEAKAGGAPITQSVAEFLLFRTYFLEGRQWARSWPCPVLYTTLHCDARGQARMCVPFAGDIGNVRDAHPAEIWNGAAARRERKAIASCQLPCLLYCSRRYNWHVLAEKVQGGAVFLRRWGRFNPK